jgi:hypothetical protein
MNWLSDFFGGIGGAIYDFFGGEEAARRTASVLGTTAAEAIAAEEVQAQVAALAAAVGEADLLSFQWEVVAEEEVVVV